jgi:hypothetical protein
MIALRNWGSGFGGFDMSQELVVVALIVLLDGVLALWGKGCRGWEGNEA